jgi:hypothetical protein
VFTRVATGRARVVREIRAAAPLMCRLRAPVPARGPWLTAVLTVQDAHRSRTRPVAVVVEPHRQGRPEAMALLSLRSRGVAVEATLLGDGLAPVPAGRPPARLLAADANAAALLAEGVLDLLASLRRPWRLRLAGLPLGCPTTAALAAHVETAAFGSARSARLVDALHADGRPVRRSGDPRELDRALPALLDRLPDDRSRAFLRTAARVHAAIGQLELGWVGEVERPSAALLTLVDGQDRWPWWGFGDGGCLGTQMGAPRVSLTATGGPRLRVELPWVPWPRWPWSPGAVVPDEEHGSNIGSQSDSSGPPRRTS